MTEPLPCTGKAAYPDEETALINLKRTQSHKVGVVMMPTRAYHCVPGCGLWHLTSKPSRRFISPILEALGLES